MKNIFLVRFFFPALIYHSDSKSSSFIDSLLGKKHLNKFIKSSLGILFSLTLTYLIYIYFRFQIKAEADKAGLTIFILFIILIIGLTSDWPKFRCIVLLALPYMASSRGRAIVLMNCVSLTTTVVAPTIINNLQQLHHFTVCNVDMV